MGLGDNVASRDCGNRVLPLCRYEAALGLVANFFVSIAVGLVGGDLGYLIAKFSLLRRCGLEPGSAWERRVFSTTMFGVGR